MCRSSVNVSRGIYFPEDLPSLFRLQLVMTAILRQSTLRSIPVSQLQLPPTLNSSNLAFQLQFPEAYKTKRSTKLAHPLRTVTIKASLHAPTMISDSQLYSLALFLGALSMLLIIL